MKRALAWLWLHKKLSGVVVFAVLLFGMWLCAQDALGRYDALLSVVAYDRNGAPVSIKENSKGHYVLPVTETPEDFTKLLIRKEDRFFYYHVGINPISTLRALVNAVVNGRAGGSSTITQQLAKNLLSTENDRNLTNKLKEAFYAISLELFTKKETILTMYMNSVYLGNQTQGFSTASLAYFDTPLPALSNSEQLALLATLSYPSSRNPWESENADYARALSARLTPDREFYAPETTEKYTLQRDASFELTSAGIDCEKSCTSTIDESVTEAIREILQRHIVEGWQRNIRSGAVVVIDPETEELIALVGTRNPKSSAAGDQINMAIEPRPIGSTVKPFIYAKGFALGLRPYTTVEDREYKYPIATGFSLYPKNYDGQYRGEVTLHEALSNSLNVPSVKVLEFIGLDTFYSFLSDDLTFSPIQDYESYQYGIALGGLEMDLLTLTHYFTLFPRGGWIAPLRVLKNSRDNFALPPQSDITKETAVIPEEDVALVHKIISDRFTGVNQFGLVGNLNINHPDYGVKTGTSRDFHDSWVVGYTSDFVVGVWIGNTENQALEQVSGSSGAGAVWHDVMEYLLTTPYNTNTPLPESPQVTQLLVDGENEWGLASDNTAEHRSLLSEDVLILSLHAEDTFEFSDTLTIPFRARTEVVWSINGTEYETAKETSFTPERAGTYEIAAYDAASGKREIVVIEISEVE